MLKLLIIIAGIFIYERKSKAPSPKDHPVDWPSWEGVYRRYDK